MLTDWNEGSALAVGADVTWGKQGLLVLALSQLGAQVLVLDVV